MVSSNPQKYTNVNLRLIVSDYENFIVIVSDAEFPIQISKLQASEVVRNYMGVGFEDKLQRSKQGLKIRNNFLVISARSASIARPDRSDVSSTMPQRQNMHR